MSEYKNYIVVIASDHKGNDFIEECHQGGWHVSLVTREKLLNDPWVWESLNNVKTVPDDAKMDDYIRAVANIAGSQPIHRIVGMDEFDVLTAAKAREHLQVEGGMSSTYALRFRDKLMMRNMASAAGISCPQFSEVFNLAGVDEYLKTAAGPWIIKPRTEVSAFGIRKCETPEQVWDTLKGLDNRNTWRDHPSQFLIEQFIIGDVFHVDSVVHNGKVVAAGVSQYGKTPMQVSHQGGIFSTSILPHKSKERKELEKLNKDLLKAFDYKQGIAHAEFLRSAETGEFYLLEVAARVGGAYIANVLEQAAGFSLWREWAKLEIATKENPYKKPRIRKDYAGITLALANQDAPDTSHYEDSEIVYRVKKSKHVGLIFVSDKHERVAELIGIYSDRIAEDFLAIAPTKERYDD